MIRLSISNKIFLTFSLVTVFTCFLGAVLYTGIKGIRMVDEALNTVTSFHMSIKDLTGFHTASADPLPENSHHDFMREFSRARFLVAQLLDSPMNDSAATASRLEMINEYLDNYRKAFEELLGKNVIDQSFPAKNAELLASLQGQMASLGPRGRLMVQTFSQRMMLMQIRLYHDRDYAIIGKAREAGEEIRTSGLSSSVKETAGHFIRNMEANYFNHLGMLDRKKFLADTAALFFSYAGETAAELSLSAHQRQKELIWAITIITFSAILFTIVLWRLTSSYFHHFLKNQKAAITAIKGAEFDYPLPREIPADEFGELTLFMKDLAGELKNSIQKITASEKKYRILTEHISDWAWEADADGRLAFSTPAVRQFTGLSHDEVLGKSLADIFSWTSLLEKIADRQAVSRLETELRHQDGRHVVLETDGAPIFDAQGKYCGYRGFSREITYRKGAEEEREKLQAQLLQAQKMESIGRFSGGIAHDFNNILTSILGYCDLVLLDMKEDDPLRAKMEIIRDSGERARSLTGQLMAFSRKQPLKMEVVNLNAVISGMVNMLRRIVGEDVELLVQHDPALPNVLADPVQIEQVLLNLVVNARDAMPRGGRLTIVTATIDLDAAAARFLEGLSTGLHVALSVTDTGLGIPKEVQEKIFEPFFTTKEKGKGTGLGLATAYGIVKQHHGHIAVHSEPGQRTTFILYLPATFQEPEVKQEKKKLAELPRGTETILVVDDEPMVLAIAADILKSLGYQVVKAENSREALEIFHQHSGIRLLLTDVVMPGMNGVELADELRAVRPDLRIAFMSGYTNDVTRENERYAGALFFCKPLAPHTLAEGIRRLLDQETPPAPP